MAAENGTPREAPGGDQDESFESLLERLESIVGQLEAGERPLDESLALYENGVSTLKRCHTILDRADKRIRMLLQDGQLREAELPNRGERSEKASTRRMPARPAAKPEAESEEAETEHEKPEDDDSASAREVHKKVENSADEPVDSEGETPHNSPTSVKSKSKTGQSGNKAGGLLFGSAQ